MNKTIPIPVQDGLQWAIQQINQKMIRELVRGTRRPSARKPNELDQRSECHACQGEAEVYITEEQAVVECPYCGGKGDLDFQDQVFLTVWRDFSSIECLVEIRNGQVREAVVTVSEGNYKAGETIELSWDEQVEALRALKEAS